MLPGPRLGTEGAGLQGALLMLVLSEPLVQHDVHMYFQRR